MWQLVQANGENADFNCISPTSRTKHATCINQDGYIYLYGGKSINNMSLKDLWRFDTENNYWEEMGKCSGDHPPSLQEHTMIAWNNKIFIFGGEVGYCSDSQETPLWQLNLDNWTWYKFGSVNTNAPGITSTQPTGRSGHTAVLFENSIYVYGGYQQLKGSLQDLWKFDLCSESWSLISGPSMSTVQPPARHYHSCVIYENQMYVYGGMNNLDAKSDFWRFCITTKTWSKMKCNRGPGELHGHSAINAFNCMFIFGGERNGNLLQELWRFNFETETWDKIHTEGMLPSARSRHTAISNPFIDFNIWDASSSISSNNSNQSDTNRLSQYNYGDREENSKRSNRKTDLKQNKKLEKEAQLKNDKNKENKCDCNRSNEGTIRKFFRKKIGRNKLVRSMSTNSYNISHNENCDFYRTNLELTSSINKKSMKKSNTCYEETIKEQTADTSLVNSNTIESLTTTATTLQDSTPTSSNLLDHILTSISNSSQVLDDKSKNDKNKLNSTNQQIHPKNTKQNIEIRKYDIGQLSDLNSPDSSPADENQDLFSELNKLNQLQQELQNKTNLELLEFVNNSSVANKKPRPKSDLITGLPNLDEESSNFDWDYGDFKRLSAQDSKSFYSLYFSSPRNLPQNKSTSYINNNHYPVKIRNQGLNGNRKARPKTYHQNLVHYENDDFKENKMISYLNSDLNEINELTPNDELFITEEEMTFAVEDSPIKNLTTSSNGYKSDFVVDKNYQIKNNDKQSPSKNINNGTNGTNNTTNSNTTTVCSPMSTSSVLGSSISQSLSQSSGYQSFMEDSLLENSNVVNNVVNNVNNVQSDHSSTNKDVVNNQQNIEKQNNNQTNKSNNQVKLRNHPNQLKLSNCNQRTNQRYSCNLPHYSNFNYEQVNDRFNTNKMNENENKENTKLNDNQNNLQTLQTDKSKLPNFNQTITKQIPNSSSNVEISLNQSKASCQLPRVESWERKMIVKTFSTNGFNGKDNLYNNSKNIQRISNSFLNLSEKVNSLDLNFLIKKKKDKKNKKGKTEYHFCMLVFGGCEKTDLNNAGRQPISVYKLFVPV